MDTQSEGGFSQSDNESQGMALVLDIETLKLGTGNVKTMILQNILIYSMPELFRVLLEATELAMIFRYVGIDCITIYTVTDSIIYLISIAVVRALSESADHFIQSNIAKQQLMIAEVYVAHFFLLAFLWIILAFVLYYALIANMFKEPIVGDYLMLRIGVCTITCTLVFGIQCFFTSENRQFVMVSKDMIFNIIYVICLVVTYTNTDKIGVSFTNSAIAYTVACVIVGMWMFILILRIPFMDVQYKGVLKFSFRKLTPVRWKILLQIMSHFVTNLVCNSLNYIQYFEAALLNFTLIKQESILLLQNTRLLMFFKMQQFAMIPNAIFKDVFQQLVSYNIGIKRISRIWDILKWTVIFDMCITVPILAVLAVVGPYFFPMFLPTAEETYQYYYLRINSKDPMWFAPLSQILQQMHYIATSLLLLEQKLGLATLIQLPNLLFVAIYNVYLFFTIWDNAPSVRILLLGQICNFILGWCFMGYFMVKYKKLYEINKKNESKQVQQDEADQTELRKNIAYQLTTNCLTEQTEQRAFSLVFDKRQMIASNNNFFNLRDAIVNSHLMHDHHEAAMNTAPAADQK